MGRPEPTDIECEEAIIAVSNALKKTFSGLQLCIDRDTCIGTGSCTHVAPEVFELDDQQKIRFINEPSHIEPKRLVEACEVCPVDALDIFDEKGNSLLS